MKILRPVPVEKRLPAIVKDTESVTELSFTPAVAVRIENTVIAKELELGKPFSVLIFAFYNHSNKCWENALPDDHSLENKNNVVVEWYEEIEFESLLPEKDAAQKVAQASSDRVFMREISHGEGQAYIINHISKNLQK